jgi:hypothetical protein
MLISGVRFVIAAVLVCLAAPGAARAQETIVEFERIDPDPSYGVGVVVGTTVGAAGKVFLGDHHALAVAIGSYHFQDGVSAQAEWLWHINRLTSRPGLVLYTGAGTRLSHWQHADHMHTDLAVRAPVGLVAELAIAPLDFFVEGAIDVNVVSAGEPHRRAAVTAAIGSRYLF